MTFRKLAVAALIILSSNPSVANDQTAVALSWLEFGASVGKLTWMAAERNNATSTAPADAFTHLAQRVQTRIDEGRATSALMGAHFDAVSTTLIYAAAVDPEPASKATAAIAAWGAKKAGDYISNKILDEAKKDALAIIATGLRETGLSSAEITAMTPLELKRRVRDFQIGGTRLRSLVGDVPGALPMLEAASIDLAVNIGMEGIARADVIQGDVSIVRETVVKISTNLNDLKDVVKQRLDRMDTRLAEVRDAAVSANAKLDDLKREVAGNSAAIGSLASISYAGWTTQQKLHAVQSGLFPDLTGPARDKAVKALEAQQSLERSIAGLTNAANDFGSLAAVASRVGMPADAVKALQGAQVVAGSLARFAAGDYLGAVAGITSLLGFGAPDPAQARHAEMMNYLKGAFAEVNAKLDHVIELQVKTLQAISSLARAQESFRKEVLGQLDRIETTVLQNQQLLLNVVLNRWTACRALLNGTALNGQFIIPNSQVFVEILGSSSLSTNVADCYSTMTEFLDSKIKSASWAGDIVAADVFPTNEIVGEISLQRAMQTYQRRKTNEFQTARNFLLNAPTSSLKGYSFATPAALFARISQPGADVRHSRAVEAAFSVPDVRKKLEGFRCNEQGVVTRPIRELLCLGTRPHAPQPPQETRLKTILSAPLLGPQAYWMMDLGLTLSNIIDFGFRESASGVFRFVDSSTLPELAVRGPSAELKASLAQRKGQQLVNKLQLLAEASILQNAVAYGDLTAAMIMAALYDPQTRSLKIDDADPSVKANKQRAFLALQANPLLARNVVLLGLRRALEERAGGTEQAEAVSYNQTYYKLGVDQFIEGGGACGSATLPREKLKDLFPNWLFEYRVTPDQKKNDAFKACPDEIAESESNPSLGSGLVVRIGDFYAQAPSPARLASGQLEQSDNLRLALVYRDRLSQALIDREVGAIMRQKSDPKAWASLAFDLLNGAWDENGGVSTQ